MLSTGLDSHPELQVAGEVLVHPTEHGIDLSGYRFRSSRKRIHKILKQTFSRFNGCIIHRKQHVAIHPIRSRKNMKVIFLSRRDWPRHLASLLVAKHSHVWHVASKKAQLYTNCGISEVYIPHDQVIIKPWQALWYLQRLAQRELQALTDLRSHQIFRLTYEDMLRDWDRVTSQVLDFLEVSPTSLTPLTRQQESRPLSEVIANLDELQKFFSGTRWEFSE